MLTAKSEDSDVVTGSKSARTTISPAFQPEGAHRPREGRTARKKGEEDEEKGTVIRVHDIRIDGARHEVTSGEKRSRIRRWSSRSSNSSRKIRLGFSRGTRSSMP
jgi:DNA-binding response OmpR family regulator